LLDIRRFRDGGDRHDHTDQHRGFHTATTFTVSTTFRM
jgi:hypothetical protein